MSENELRLHQELTPLPWSNPYWVHATILCSSVELTTRQFAGGELRTNYFSHPTILISGLGNTNADGKLDIQLEYPAVLSCDDSGYLGEGAVIVDPDVVFSASPKSDKPIFLTWTERSTRKSFGPNTFFIDLITKSQPRQIPRYRFVIDIYVHSWNPDSTPAKNIQFSWNCLVEAVGVSYAV